MNTPHAFGGMAVIGYRKDPHTPPDPVENLAEPRPMSHQPEPLTRAAILKLGGDELSAAVIVAKGGKLCPHDQELEVLRNANGVQVGGRRSSGKWFVDDRYRYATDWNAAGELLGVIEAAGHGWSLGTKPGFHACTIYGKDGRAVVCIAPGNTAPEAISRAFLLWKLNPQA